MPEWTSGGGTAKLPAYFQLNENTPGVRHFVFVGELSIQELKILMETVLDGEVESKGATYDGCTALLTFKVEEDGLAAIIKLNRGDRDE